MINFLKYKKIYYLISTIVILVGFWGLLTGGMRPSIDFTGGTELEYKADKSLNEAKIREVFAENFTNKDRLNLSILPENQIHILYEPIDEKKEAEVRKSVENKLSLKLTTLRFEVVGPTLGSELLFKTVIASLLATIGILLYITYAFKRLNYGLAAVMAMVHDLLVLWGVFGLVIKFTTAQVDTLFVTAVLTTLSFSVHDTIVVFDKIRELKRKSMGSIENHANKALTETMVRSLNNSLTIALMLLCLVLLGGETTRYFAVALLIGTITGTYSSPFIATPILVWLENRKK